MAVSVSSAPRLIIVQPAAGSVVMSTTVNVAYTAVGDLTEVNHVHFKLDANPEVMDLTFDGVYQFTNVLVGSHVLQGYLVRADHSKILGTDASVSFTTAAEDVTPPSVAITVPAPGANLTGTVTVTADASDNSGTVAGVQFFLDGAPLAPEITTAPFSTSWNTVTATNGSHNLTARARDGSGNQTVSTQVAGTVVNSTSTDPAVAGLWSQVLDWPLVATHTNPRPNGNATGPEVFNPAAGTWTRVTGAPLDMPYYPHVFVLPDGRILVAGSNRLEIPTYALNIAAQTWTTVDPIAVHAGSAVMYTPGKIMKAGRGWHTDTPTVPAVAPTYVLDMTG